MTAGKFTTFQAKGPVPSGTPRFSSLKMLSTCQICRKRKMKCVVLPGQITCEKCKKFNRKCTFDYKKVESKFSTEGKGTVGGGEVGEGGEGGSSRAGSGGSASGSGRSATASRAGSGGSWGSEGSGGPRTASRTASGTPWAVQSVSGGSLVAPLAGHSTTEGPLAGRSTAGESLEGRSTVAKSLEGPSIAGGSLKGPSALPLAPPTVPETSPAVPSALLSPPPSAVSMSMLFTMVPSLFRRWNLLSHPTTPEPDSPLLPDSHSPSDGALELYHQKVEADTPFLPAFAYQQIDTFCEWCIQIAADDSPETTSDVSVSSLVSEQLKWTPTALACFFLLPFHVDVPTSDLSKVFRHFQSWIDLNPAHLLNPDPNLFAGAMVVDAWTSLLRDTPLRTDLADLNILDQFNDNVDEACFSYRLISLGLMVYDFLSILAEGSRCTDKHAFWISKRSQLLSFEFDMLIFPVRLSMELSVVSDSVQSTPEAMMLHLLGNTLMIAYYGTAALKKGEYARNLSLYSIPGLYLFIAGMATSIFVVGPRIRDRWTIVSECEIFTARYILALNREMPFDDFKESLHFFLKDRTFRTFQTAESSALFDEIEDLLGDATYPDTPKEGATVYWVFRDTRSMTLDLYLSDDRMESVNLISHR